MKHKKTLAILMSSLLSVGCMLGTGCSFGPSSSEGSDSEEEEKGLIDYEEYKDEYYVDIAAWGFPAMQYDSASASYDTPKNNALAKEIADAGFTTVNFAGRNNLYPGRGGVSVDYVIEQDKLLMDLFKKNGLNSTVYTSNYTNGGVDGVGATNWNYEMVGLPDFSKGAGFNGLLVWDEPLPAVISKLAVYAEQFNEIYRGTDAVFKVNLFPSYWTGFAAGGYSNYLKSYCETVLSKVEGEKYLSVDTYAIKTDKEIESYLLYDIAMVKKYAMEYDAHAHVVLQSSQTANKKRTPAKSEYALQANAALAFGMDSISWYTYITPQEDGFGNDTAPVDTDGKKNAAYANLQEVNKNIAAFGYAYKCFDWRGVMLNPVTQSATMNLVKKNKELTDYVLTANDVNSISKISSEQDYLMGVMEDANGNEGFMLVNFSALKDNIDSVVDLTFSEADHLMIWRNGEKEILEIENNTISLTLSQGEGVFMVPYKA